MKFKSEVQLEALNNATVDTDKFLVSDSSTVKYRTGAEVLSDIGGQAALTNPITGTGTLNYVSKFTGTTTLGNSQIFDNGTSVLVGTTTPHIGGVKFLVYEPSTPTIVAYFQNNNANCYTGYHSSGTTLNSVRIGASGNNLVFSVTPDGSPNERMRITSDGNVGIGTTIPSAKLDVTDTSAGNIVNNITVQNASNTAGTEAGVFFAPTTATGNIRGARITGIQEDGNNTIGLKFYTGYGASPTEKMRITSGGNVGIGTTSPSYKLSIQGSAGIEQSEEYFYFNSSYSIGSNARGKIRAVGAGGGSGYGGDLRFSSRASNNVWNEDVMTISNNGNVGIGTTSPSEKLHISGNTLVTGTLEVDTVNNGVGDFLTRTAGGIVTRRTAAEVRSDIGAQAALTNPVTGTGTLNFVSKFTSTGSTLGNSQIFDNGTSVGIGTSGPLNKVDIVSSNNDSFGAITVRPSNQTQTLSLGWQGVSASLNFIVNAGASERMRITSVGNTGINTSIPETRLQIEDITKVLTNNVSGVAQGTLSLVSTDAQAANIGASLVFGGNYIDSNSTRIAYAAITGRKSNGTTSNADGYLSFLTWRTTGLTEAMRITSAGNVGIGTNSAGTRLYVDYTTNGSDGIVSRNLSSGTSAFGYVGAYNNLTNGIDLRSYSSTHASLPSTSVIQSSSGQTGGTIIIQSGANPIRFNTNASERMRISGTGEVGIGTTSPSARLQVVGGSDTWTGLALRDGGSDIPIIDFRVSDNSTRGSIRMNGVNSVGGDRLGLFSWVAGTGLSEVMSIKGGGNVGIGTTTPSFPLSFGTGLGNKIALYDNGSGTGYGFGIQASLLQIFSDAQLTDITFGYGNSASMVRNVTFKGTGNVGIGTTAPADKLDVNGSIRFRLNTPSFTGAIDSGVLDFVPTSIFPTDPQIRLAAIGTATVGSSICFQTGLSTTVAERMRITSAGNVGIGISNPVAKLDVFSSGTVQTAVLGRGLDGNFRLTTRQDVSTNTDGSIIGEIGVDYITTKNTAVRFHRGGSTTGGFISFTTNDGSERMRITSAGAMGLGVTPTNTAGRFEASNDIVAYSSSDRRWKTNIKNIDSPLEKISKINGVEFDWIEDEPVHGNKGHDIGVIAQEIEQILPDAVQTRESGMKAVKYEKVIPLLIEAIKEQQKQIEELKQLLNGITN